MMFTFSIPITIMGTLYGMNVRLPGGLEEPLTFLGPYTTFFVILAVAGAMVSAMYFVFRKFRWL
jgi:magnesium transporter